MKDYAQFLRALATQILDARLSSGASLRDATDFREWLVELAGKADQAETLDQFWSQT